MRGRFDSLPGTFAAYGAALAFIVSADYAVGVLADVTYGGDKAKGYLEESGYKNPQLTDVDKLFVGVRGCAESDTLSYDFSVERGYAGISLQRPT